jgi:4-hydroxyphenylpyruvate dioxygenase
MGLDAHIAANLPKTLIGPIFFEFIQKKGDYRFGERNFRALFERMNRKDRPRGADGP